MTLVAVCSGWGTIPLLAERIDLPPSIVVLARVTIATAVLAAISTARGHRLPRPTARVLVAGALLAVHWTAMFAAYERAPDDTVVFVVFLAPVGIALLAPRTLGERIGPRTLAALALAVPGFVLVAAPALEPGSATGLAWAGLSAVTFVALVLVSKPLAEELGALRLNLLEMAVAGALLLPFVLLTRPDATGLGRALPWLAVLGVVHTALGITLYLAALARVPATHAGILGYLEPVAVVVLGWLVGGRPPSATTALGGACVVLAGALVALATAASTTPEVPARVPG